MDVNISQKTQAYLTFRQIKKPISTLLIGPIFRDFIYSNTPLHSPPARISSLRQVSWLTARPRPAFPDCSSGFSGFVPVYSDGFAPDLHRFPYSLIAKHLKGYSVSIIIPASIILVNIQSDGFIF